MRKKVTDYLLYRWRYVLGYGFIGLAVAGLLVVSALYIPGGISESEIRSVVESSSIDIANMSPGDVAQLPYRLLQNASIHIFGVTQIGIKLPSLILSILSIVGMLLLLKSWFRANVAVLTTILAVTTSQFLALSQSGTSSIVYIFCSVWLLVAALRVSRQVKHLWLWKIALFSVAAISLYTPLSVYILLALASATVLHPHLRYLARRAMKARLKMSIALACALLIISPLVWAVIKEPNIGLFLLGIPAEWPDISRNIASLFDQYFNFISPTGGSIIQPIYALGPFLLIILGIVQLLTTNYTARSYVITTWIILLTPALIINPAYTSVTFIPAMILMAMGVHFLLSSWYGLFPKNPYARIAGLLPLSILIGSMVLTGVARYSYGYLYDPVTNVTFTNDVRLINKELSQHAQVTIVTSDKQASFYSVVAKHSESDVTVSTDYSAVKGSPYVIVTRSAHATLDETLVPYRIITDENSQNADRFYIYTTEQK